MECANQGKQYRNTQLDSKQQDADRKTAEHLDTHRRDDEGRTGTAAVEHHPLGISWVDFLLLEQRSDGFGAHRIPADHPQQQDAAQLRGKKEQPAGHPGKGEGKKTVQSAVDEKAGQYHKAKQRGNDRLQAQSNPLHSAFCHHRRILDEQNGKQQTKQTKQGAGNFLNGFHGSSPFLFFYRRRLQSNLPLLTLFVCKGKAGIDC